MEDKNDDNEAASFEVINISANSFNTLSSDENWPELKDKAQLGLNACIQDRAYQMPVVGDKFTIKSDNGSYTAQSSGDGCISWDEEFRFDYTADETFYEVSGQIINEDNFLGSFKYNLAVNPWTQQIIFLERGGKPLKITALSDTKKSLTKSFNLRQYEMSVNDYSFDGKKASLALNFMAMPVLVRKLIDERVRDDEIFTRGEFTLEFDLFQRVRGEKIREVVAHTSTNAKIAANGQLETSVNFDIDKIIDYDTILELVVSASADGSKVFLGDEEKYLVIDNLDQAQSGELLNLPQDKAQMLAQASQYTALSKNFKSRVAIKKHGLLIDGITGTLPRLEVDGNLNRNSMKNTILAGINLSLVDTLVFNGVNGTFRVTLEDLTSGTLLFDDNVSTRQRKNSGHLVFDAKISYDEDYEFNYRRHRITVMGLSGRFAGVQTSRDVYINPRVSSANYIRDAFDYTKPTISTNDDENNAPQIYFDQAEFNFVRNEEDLEQGILYQVNKNLDLLNERVVSFKLHPKQKLKHNYNGRANGHPMIKTGRVNVSFMLFTPKNANVQSYNRAIDLNDFYLLTADKVEDVAIEDGLLNVELSLPHLFEARKLMSFKNIGVLYVESANENSKIQPGYMVGSIEILNRNGIFSPLMDSRLSSAKVTRLRQSNQGIIKKANRFIKKKSDILEKDENITDRFVAFKEVITSAEIQKNVNVFDPENHGSKKEITQHFVYDTEKMFHKSIGQSVSTEVIQKVLTQSFLLEAEEVKQFCRLFYDPTQKRRQTYSALSSYGSRIVEGEMFKNCLRSPLEYIGFHEMNFMHKITKQPAQLKRETGMATAIESTNNLMRNEAHFMTKGQMFQDINGMRTSAATILGLHKYASILGIEIGRRTDKFDMSQEAEILSQQRRIINQNGQNFLVTTVDLSFEAQYKKCVMISPKWVSIEKPLAHKNLLKENISKPLWYFFNEKPDNTLKLTSAKRHIVCQENLENRILNESWFFVRLAHYHTDRDVDNSMAKNTVGDIFRGQKAYEQYRLMDLNNDKHRLLVKLDSNDEVTKRYQTYIKRNGKSLKYDERLGIAFPGLLEPITTEHDKRKLREILNMKKED